jgi:hypothetical protein
VCDDPIRDGRWEGSVVTDRSVRDVGRNVPDGGHTQGDIGQADRVARVANRLAREQPVQDVERLVEDAATLAVGHRECLVLGLDGWPATHAHAEPDTATAQHVKRRDLVGDVHRVPERRQIHRRPEVQIVGAPGDGRQRHQRLGSGFREDAVADPRAVEPSVLGRDGEFEDVPFEPVCQFRRRLRVQYGTAGRE